MSDAHHPIICIGYWLYIYNVLTLLASFLESHEPHGALRYWAPHTPYTKSHQILIKFVSISVVHLGYGFGPKGGSMADLKLF